MKTKSVIHYIADCGRKYHTKKCCLSHELVCKCWTDPKYRTCKTCKFEHWAEDGDGYRSWRVNDCKNPKFNYDIHFKQAHEKAPDLCINCTLWEPKQSNGETIQKD
jgi:hypothetical protein